ncbi:MAG TPA: response regulator [Beijerinckiaceae bacterium]|jgi:DNA-binding response OmpR family regulator
MKGCRVLIAEDEALVALDLADSLLQIGAEVVATTGLVREGLRFAETTTIDVALLDFNLADGVATPLAEALQQRGAAVVFYSGRGVPEEALQRVPGAAVLKKPLRFETIAGTLRACRPGLSSPARA